MRYKLSPLSIRETSNGAAISGATVTVYLAGTSTLATCYADTTTGTPLTGSNTTTTASGYFEFFIDPKDYRATQKFKIVVSKTGYADVPYDNLTVLQEITEVINVKDFGAVGDGNTNDTTAIQNAINAAIGLKSGVYFPFATYKITSALSIPMGSHWRIDLGESTIVQDTDNTPVFKFNSTGSTDQWNFFRFGGGKLTWTNTQSSSNTSAVAVAFTTSTDNAYGIYAGEFHDLQITKGFRGLATTHATYKFTVWGNVFRNIRGAENTSGSLIYINFSNSAGMPNNRFENIYGRCDSMASTEHFINLNQCVSTTLDNIEANNLSDNKVLLLTSCVDTTIGMIRAEGGTISTNFRGVIEISSCSGTIIDAIEVQSVTFSGTYNYIVRDTTGLVKISRTQIRNIIVRSCTVSGTALYLLASAYRMTILNDFYLSTNTGTVKPVYSFDNSIFNCKVTALDDGPFNVPDSGNADTTLYFKDVTNGTSPAYVLYNTAITADRAVTLPSDDTRYPGMRYRVTRTAAATGSFNVNVGTGPLKALAAGQWCEVILFQATSGTFTWQLTAFGSL